MSALSELLERLRRLRPPPGGPAGVVAVPFAGEDVSGEVAFLFAELDAIDAEMDRLVALARSDAAALAGEARAERARILAHAREQAEREWARVLAERHAAHEREARALRGEGEREAARVVARGRERIPALVDEVVRRIGGQPT